MKLRAVGNETHGGYVHWCPGCNERHVVYTRNGTGPTWDFVNKNEDTPTFSPSVRLFEIEKDNARVTLCHYFIKEGKLQFLHDCAHDLAGQTVDLPNLPDDE